MNKTFLLGNLATDVKLRTTATNKEVASFKLAVNREGQNAGADFIWIKTWNGTATACARYLKKGSRVAVDGSIRTSRVGEGADIKEYVEVNARQVTFLDAANGNGANNPPPIPDDETPEAGNAENTVGVTVTASTPEPEEDSPAAAAAPTAEIADDDIPF